MKRVKIEVPVSYHAGKGSTMSQIANATKTAINKLDEGGSGDCFDRKCAEKAQPYFMAAALMNPLIGVPNSIKTITTGSDIYGVSVTQTDKGMSWVSIGLTAVSSEHPLLGTASKIINLIGAYNASKQYKNEKEKKSN